MNKASETPSFLEGLNGAVRENPIAAGLVGIGVAWMLLGNSRVSEVRKKIPSAVKKAAGTFGSTLSASAASVGDGIGKATSQLADAAGHLGSEVSERLWSDDTPDSAKQPLRSAELKLDAGNISEAETDARAKRDRNPASMQAPWKRAAKLQEQLGEVFEAQPLVLGAIGLAIGVGMASVFATTDAEGELIGAYSDATREKVSALATDAKTFALERGEQVMEAVRDQAQAQGFTPAQAKDSLREVAGKAKNIAETARQSVINRVS